MRRFAIAALACVVLSVLLLGNCGSSGSPSPSQVIASITPAQSTLKTGENITLTGSATGFTAPPIVTWWIQEARSADTGDDCAYLKLPAMSPCPYGYVIFPSVTQFPSVATYYAPSTPGTYHVVFEAIQSVEYHPVSKTVTAAVTVTP